MLEKRRRRELWQTAGLSLVAIGVLVTWPSWMAAQAVSKLGGAGTPVTFSRDVAPILQEKCVVCHRPEAMAPMSLEKFEDVRPWARSIKAKVEARQMPPWHIDKTVGIQRFKNDRSLSDAEISTIVRWIDAGAPAGNPKDLPAPKQWPDEDVWSLAAQYGQAEPDLIVKSTPYTMKAQSPDVWWQPVVATGLTEERWVRAIETRPSHAGRRIVHHAVTYAIQDEGAAFRTAQQLMLSGKATVEQALEAQRLLASVLPVEESADNPEGGAILCEWAIGKQGEIYPEDTGKLLKAGSKIRYDIHYHANGKDAVTDQTEVGLYFYPKGYVPKYRVTMFSPSVVSAERRNYDDLDIPPNSMAVHNGYTVLRQPARLLSFQPHMHLRGKAMMMEAIYPNGRVETLSHVPNFEFNWMVPYIYADDVAPLLPKGTVIHITSWHDNTAANKNNPDPNQWVGWGGRTVDEMSMAHVSAIFLTEEDYQKELAKRNADLKKTTQQ